MPTEAKPSLGWVDSHCHLYMHGEPPGAVLDRGAAAGVRWIMCPGVDAETSASSRDLAARFPSTIRWSAGLHPHDASEWPAQGQRLAELVTAADAVGECGLDFYRNLAPRRHQLDAFRDQLDLAVVHDKPVIVHCRDAFSDVFDLLGQADLGERAVLHCWTGGRKWTKRFDELGVTFSFAGPLTYAGGETLRLAAAEAPIGRTMIETDTPYLTPEPKRSEVNEPANVAITGSALAEVWAVPVDEVARSTADVAARVFGAPE